MSLSGGDDGVADGSTAVPSTVYFAFGSNMPSDGLAAKGMEAYASCPGIIDGWKLVFNLATRSPVDPSFANVMADASAQTAGVLHVMNDADFARLDSIELVYHVESVLARIPRSLEKADLFERFLVEHDLRTPEDVAASTPDTLAVTCSTFVTTPEGLDAFKASSGETLPVFLEEIPPSERYLNVLLRGIDEHDVAAVAPEYCEWLHAHPFSPLEKLQVTPEQLAEIARGTVYSLAALSASMAEEAEGPRLLALRGVVFDLDTVPIPNAFKTRMGGADNTRGVAMRAGRLCNGEPLSECQTSMIDAVLMHWLRHATVVGHVDASEDLVFPLPLSP